MSKERRRLGSRTAKVSAGLLLLLAISLFLAGALSVAGTFLGDPEDRPMSTDHAVLGVHVRRAEATDGGHDHMHDGGGHAPPAGIPARITLTSPDTGRERTLRTDAAGFLHLDLPAGTYTVGVTTRDGNGTTEMEVRGITHLLALQQDDGSITFEVDRHRPHHPPFRAMADHPDGHGPPR